MRAHARASLVKQQMASGSAADGVYAELADLLADSASFKRATAPRKYERLQRLLHGKAMPPLLQMLIERSAISASEAFQFGMIAARASSFSAQDRSGGGEASSQSAPAAAVRPRSKEAVTRASRVSRSTHESSSSSSRPVERRKSKPDGPRPRERGTRRSYPATAAASAVDHGPTSSFASACSAPSRPDSHSSNREWISRVPLINGYDRPRPDNVSRVLRTVAKHSSSGNLTLVCLMGNLRAGPAAWDSVAEHVLRPLSADLAMLLPASTNRTKLAPLLRAAKFIWWHPEHEAWDDLLEQVAGRERPGWRRNVTLHHNLWGGLSNGKKHGRVYIIGGSGAITMTLRMLLLERLDELKRQGAPYTRVVVTRTDQFFHCDHPDVVVHPQQVHVPDGDDGHGLLDKHIVFAFSSRRRALSVLPWLVRGGLMRVCPKCSAPETALAAYYQQIGMEVCRFVRTHFSSAAFGDSTRWQDTKNLGAIPVLHGGNLYCKYETEHRLAALACRRSASNGTLKGARGASLASLGLMSIGQRLVSRDPKLLQPTCARMMDQIWVVPNYSPPNVTVESWSSFLGAGATPHQLVIARARTEQEAGTARYRALVRAKLLPSLDEISETISKSKANIRREAAIQKGGRIRGHVPGSYRLKAATLDMFKLYNIDAGQHTSRSAEPKRDPRPVLDVEIPDRRLSVEQ